MYLFIKLLDPLSNNKNIVKLQTPFTHDQTHLSASTLFDGWYGGAYLVRYRDRRKRRGTCLDETCLPCRSQAA